MLTQLPKVMESQGWFARNFRKVWMWISPPPFQVDDEGVLFDKLPRARVRLPLVPQMLRILPDFRGFWSGQKSPKTWKNFEVNHFRNHQNEHLSEGDHFFHWWNSHTLECVQTWCARNNAYWILLNLAMYAEASHLLSSLASLSSCAPLIAIGLGLERETVRELSARGGLEFGQGALNIKGFLICLGYWYGIFWIAQIYPNIAAATYPERSWMPMRGRDIMARWCQLKVPDDTTLVD